MKDVIASLFFSVLILVFFTVALHHRDAPRLQAAPPSAAPEQSPIATKPEATTTPERRKVATTVAPGEDLAAVARRVYGSQSPEILDQIWQANRDQLPNRDSPITAGTLLRTP